MCLYTIYIHKLYIQEVNMILEVGGKGKSRYFRKEFGKWETQKRGLGDNFMRSDRLGKGKCKLCTRFPEIGVLVK